VSLAYHALSAEVAGDIPSGSPAIRADVGLDPSDTTIL
jgi:hypothetical protein